MPSLLRVLLPLLVLLAGLAGCGAITPATTQTFGDGQSRGGA
jgi:hypothetical protein